MNFFSRFMQSGPPDVEHLHRTGNVKGLIRALDYQSPPESQPKIRMRAFEADDPAVALRREAALALAIRADKRAIPAFIRQVQMGDSPPIRRICAQYLAHFHSRDAVPALASVMHNFDDNLFISAIWSLAHHDVSEVAAYNVTGKLLPLLRQGMPAEGYYVIHWLLARHGSESVIQALLAEFDNLKFSYAVYLALGQMRATQAVPQLIETLGSDWEYQRIGAALALGQIGDVRSIAPLIDRFRQSDRDRDQRLCQAIIEALQAIGEPALHPVLNAVIAGQHGLSPVLVHLGAASVTPILKQFDTTQDADLKARLIEVLGEIGDARAVEAILPALRDSNHRVVSRAVVALGHLKDSRAVQPLIDLALGLNFFQSENLHLLNSRIP